LISALPFTQYADGWNCPICYGHGKVIEKTLWPNNICIGGYFTLIVLYIELIARPDLKLAPRIG
jgi:hypothetical protein